MNATSLPLPAELQAFSRVAARLLAERQAGLPGQRTVRRRAGVGTQHLDHRDYVPGDDVRRIDWRVTARRRRPIVRQFEAETTGDWVVLVDASSSLAVRDARKWRAAANGAAAMCHALLSIGHRVGLIVFAGALLAECRPGRGRTQYARIARQLGRLRPAATGARSELGACARRLRGDASVVVFSDFLAEDELRGDLAAVLDRSATLHALALCDGGDVTLDATGEVELVDVETGARRTVDVDGTAAAHARDERAAMTARLRAFCLRSGVAFSAWDVDTPWQRALVQHLAQARGTC